MSTFGKTIRKAFRLRNTAALHIRFSQPFNMLCAIILSHIYTSEAFARGRLDAMSGLKNFGTIAENTSNSASSLPGLVTAFSYLCGILLGCMAVIKLKDHVENPKQVPLKKAGVMMAVGGAFMALPIIYESMFTSIGDTNNAPLGANLSSVSFFVGN